MSSIEIEVRKEPRVVTTHALYVKTFPSKEWVPVFYGNERDANLSAILLRDVLTALHIAQIPLKQQEKTVRRIDLS